MIKKYSKEIEENMRKVYRGLDEKSRRRYAAVEAQKLGHGAIKYISKILGISPKTISAGCKELAELKKTDDDTKRIRKAGGGRKKQSQKFPQLIENFNTIVEKYMAGSPMNEDIIWIDISLTKLSEEVSKLGIKCSPYICKQLLAQKGLGLRKMSKELTLKNSENRDEQFKNINNLIEEFKKKEIQ